jgi:negative regulator of genetic competence, sporulation and motility
MFSFVDIISERMRRQNQNENQNQNQNNNKTGVHKLEKKCLQEYVYCVKNYHSLAEVITKKYAFIKSFDEVYNCDNEYHKCKVSPDELDK